MTREEAKTWLSIPREKLAVVAQNIDRHYDVIVAYANGADVQIVDIDTSEWIDIDDPIFAHSRAYRVKPSAETAGPWKPKYGELFFCICQNGEVVSVYFNDGCEIDSRYVAFGNCFKTRVEAEAARERVRSALKGETVSKTEKVESLDGNPLSDAEKKILRTLRDYKYEVIGQSEFAFVNDDERLDTNIGVLVIFPFENDNVDEEFSGALREISNGNGEATK